MGGRLGSPLTAAVRRCRLGSLHRPASQKGRCGRRYRFRHALIQDAAYENLLKSRRQILHRRVAENPEQQTDGQPE